MEKVDNMFVHLYSLICDKQYKFVKLNFEMKSHSAKLLAVCISLLYCRRYKIKHKHKYIVPDAL